MDKQWNREHFGQLCSWRVDEVSPFSLEIGFESLFGKLPPQARAHLKPLVPLTCKPTSELVTKNHGLISHKRKLNLQKERDV